MVCKTKCAALVLTQEQRATLEGLTRSRTAPRRKAERTRLLVGHANGMSVTGLAPTGVERPKIYRCIDKPRA